jgi:hypothetical protein
VPHIGTTTISYLKDNIAFDKLMLRQAQHEGFLEQFPVMSKRTMTCLINFGGIRSSVTDRCTRNISVSQDNRMAQDANAN